MGFFSSLRRPQPLPLSLQLQRAEQKYLDSVARVHSSLLDATLARNRLAQQTLSWAGIDPKLKFVGAAIDGMEAEALRAQDVGLRRPGGRLNARLDPSFPWSSYDRETCHVGPPSFVCRQVPFNAHRLPPLRNGLANYLHEASSRGYYTDGYTGEYVDDPFHKLHKAYTDVGQKAKTYAHNGHSPTLENLLHDLFA